MADSVKEDIEMGLWNKFRKAKDRFEEFQHGELEKELEKYSKGDPEKKEKLRRQYFASRDRM